MKHNSLYEHALSARDIYFLILRKLKKNERVLVDYDLFEYGSYEEFFKVITDVSRNKEVLALAEKGLNLYNYSSPSE